MPEAARILVADHEATFLSSTCELLRSAGYACEGVSGVEQVEAALHRSPCDVLVAGIDPAGNLELLQGVLRSFGSLPVIVVTAQPSLDTAIQAVQLAVSAYLVKPLDADQLLGEVRAALVRSQLCRTVDDVGARLGDWQSEMHQLKQSLAPVRSSSAGAINAFVKMTLANVVHCLSDLAQVIDALANHPQQAENLCQLLSCPRLNEVHVQLGEAIDVLERTKSSFRSKELGQLRKKLEALAAGLKNAEP